MGKGLAFHRPDRPGVLLHPLRVLLALHDGLELLGQVVEVCGTIAGDPRWQDVGQRLRRAARELAPP